MTGRIWTFSNALSAARVLLVVPIAVLLLEGTASSRMWAAAIIVLAVATDFLDGFFARRLHQVSELGKIIDPLADKIAVAAVGVILVIEGAVPLWYVALVLVRDLVILTGGVIIRSRKQIIPQSNWPGKIAVTAIALVMLLAVVDLPGLEPLETVALWGSVACMVLSVAVYAKRLSIGTQ